MTAKTYTALAAQANADLADNNARDIVEADVRQMVLDLLDSINESTIGMVGWEIETGNDFVPKVTGQGIGSVDASPIYVAVGDVATDGLEGVIAARSDANGGGILIFGYRGDPVGADASNAPVYVAGNVIVLDGVVMLTVPEAIAEDHFLITKPSVVLPNGQHAVPIVLGPEYDPTTEETPDTSGADVSITPVATEIDILGGTEGDGLVLANAYAVGEGTVQVILVLEETGGGEADITVRIKVDPLGVGSPVVEFTDVIKLRNSRFNYFLSVPNDLALAATDELSVHVQYANGDGGGTRTVTVKGTIAASSITVMGT